MKGIEPRTRYGRKVWRARPIVNGVRLPSRTFDTLKEAKAYKATVEAQGAPKAFTESCRSFAERWTEDYVIVKSGPTRGQRKKESTLDTYRGFLRPFIEDFGDLRLDQVDRSTARAFALKHRKAAEVLRSMYADAMEDGLCATNPFQGLRLEQSKGRKDHSPLTVSELHKLADMALDIHGRVYGPRFRAMILFTAYVGLRKGEAFDLERRDLDFQAREVRVRQAKFDKPRTVLMLDEAADAVRDLIGNPYLFTTKTGKRFTGSSHFPVWDKVRAAFLASLTATRRQEIGEFVFHSLRHFTGHHFYVTLGYSDELAAYQLGHSDAKLVRDLYGHGQDDALARLKRAASPSVTPIKPQSRMAGGK